MIRGQKFEIDLDSDEEHHAQPVSFVGDVLEREPAAPIPPRAPSKTHPTGFPAHTKRKVESRFLMQKNAPMRHQSGINNTSTDIVEGNAPRPMMNSLTTETGSGNPESWEEEEKQRIDQENRQKLAHMSPDEIEEERKELLDSLSPALIQRLLQRSTIDSGGNESDLTGTSVQNPAPRGNTKPKATKTVSFEVPSQSPKPKESSTSAGKTNPDATAFPPADIHFPRPSQPPDLDPSSDSFLEDLHSKYFPSLPSEPEKLEWMQPNSTSPTSYDPAASAFHAKDLRFSFKGELIPPRTSAEIPVTLGLHHHGDSPNSAGYTISELAHLSRSTYAAQRCIAFQTLGRLLFRLGRGEFGNPSENSTVDPDDDHSRESFARLANELWEEMNRTQVVETLIQESEGKGVDGGRHASAKAYATEAVWLWRKGGGRRWKAA